MILRVGRPRRALIIAPHPDDETIGAHGLIDALRHGGSRIELVVATDGAGSHRASPRWPARRLVCERRRETLRAMRRLGVSSAAIGFLGLPDGAAERAAWSAWRGLVHAAARLRPGDLLVAPVPDDDHDDHRAVARAVARLRLPGVRRLAYPVWPIGRRDRHCAALRLGGAGASAKRHAIRRYRTQTGLIRDDPRGFALTPRQIAAFSRPRELFVERAR